MVSWPARSSDRPSGALESWANRLTAVLTTASSASTMNDQRQEP